VSGAACRVAAYVTAALVAGPYLVHLARGSQAFLGLLEDDHFYYSVIADKLLTTGRMTFDGTTLTNGFHPLWFVVITLLRLVCGRFGTAYYLGLTAVFVACMLVTYELGRRFARALGAGPALAPVIAVAYSGCVDRLFTMGMEATIAVPLLLWFFVEAIEGGRLTPRRAAKLGLLASLAILGRLDVVMAVGLLLGAWVLLERPSVATLRRVVPPFCAAGFLVPVYAVANWVYFGSVLPVSAQAKRIYRPGFDPSFLRSVALNSVFGQTIAVLLPLGAVALLLLVRREPRVRPASRVVGGVAIAFAFVFFGINALPGWIFFGWYAYPLVTAALASLVFACELLGPYVKGPRLARVPIAIGAVVVLLAPARAARYFDRYGLNWTVGDNSLLASSMELAERVRERPGVYSMGAIAGVATYVLDKPVVQLEGLVADRTMLDHLRHEDPLQQVLRDYDVDYLVLSLAYEEPTKHDGCYVVTEPNPKWAGPRVATMRGEICSEPVERFFTPAGGHPWSQFPQIETLVFDVKHAAWRQP
jgi:hypothetical protein